MSTVNTTDLTLVNRDGTSYKATIGDVVAAVGGSAGTERIKAWLNLDASTTTPAIRGSLNVSSVTATGSGNYRVNFRTALPTAIYSAVVSVGCNSAFALARASVFTADSYVMTAPLAGSFPLVIKSLGITTIYPAYVTAIVTA